MRKAALTYGRFKVKRMDDGDVKLVETFTAFINGFIDDPDAMTSIKYGMTVEGERRYLEDTLFLIGAAKKTVTVAWHGSSIAALAHAELMQGRKEHVAEFGILVSREHRSQGLGDMITGLVLSDAAALLVPRPAIIRLSVFETNEKAIGLYRKHGFEEVARIPRQFELGDSLVDEIIMIRDA